MKDYSPFGAPLPGRTYNAIEEMNKVELSNQIFASGVDGWTTANSNTTVANSSGQLRLQTTNTASVSMSKTYSTTSGTHYRISFDADAASYTNVNVEIVGYGGNALSSATLNTGITHYQLDFTANDASTVVKVSLGTGTGTRTIYLDNVKLEEIKGSVKGYTKGFNGRESIDEANVPGGLVDLGDRWHDVRLGRTLKIDAHAYKYAFISPYAYALNDPLNVIDPDGKDVYLIIWTTKNGSFGHAAIAVDNYKLVEIKVVENGKTVTKMEYVKDGTVTYYDVHPAYQVGLFNANSNVKATYTVRQSTPEKIKKEDTNGTTDNNSPDGVIKFTTDHNTDIKAIAALKAFMAISDQYNGVSRNCSDMAQRAVEQAINKAIDATEKVMVFYNATTPNLLFRIAMAQANAVIEKDPGKDVEKTFEVGVKESANDSDERDSEIND